MSKSQPDNIDQSDQEPTMEEILSSIRKIISEDDQIDKPDTSSIDDGISSSKEGQRELNQSSKKPYDANDVLDLTQMVLDDGTKVELDNEGNPANSNKKNYSKGSCDLGDQSLKSKLDALGLIAASKNESKNGSGLLDSITAETAAAAFAQLASTRAEKATTLEELVKDLLRPMLKSWLDENLTQVVGRLVEKEISKLSGKADES